MENIIKKKKDTIGPFPSPITGKVGIHNLGFETYNEYEHGSDVNCCTWDITETGHTATEDSSEMNICGPFSMFDTSLHYTCQLSKCDVKCLCALCRSPPCDMMLCKGNSYCSECNVQCSDHFVGVLRDFDKKHDSLVNGEKCPGIPKNCKNCQSDIQEHKTWHSVIHSRCRFCKCFVEKLENASTLKECEENKKVMVSLDSRTCNKCFKVFSRQNYRKVHEDSGKCMKEGRSSLSMENKPKPKQYTCDICAITLSGKHNLTRHMKIHEESFTLLKCNKCETSFMREDNLEAHMINVHNYVEKSKNTYFPVNRESKQYVCDICDSVFKTKGVLNRHKKSVHDRENYFQCRYCQKEFNRKDNAQKHSQICTQDPGLFVREIITNILDDM